MTVYNLGSINCDLIYRLPHLPQAGETLAATAHARGLGGKGANQSVALARAGAKVRHIGAVGADGAWMVARMAGYGVDCAHVAEIDAPSGHAVILLDADGENSIVLYPGANRLIAEAHVANALSDARAGDVLVLQNETVLQVEAARFAQEQGLFVVYSAAPFDADQVRAILPHVSLLLLNAVEAEQLCAALEQPLEALPVAAVCVTHGAKGAVYHDLALKTQISQPAFPVEVVDPTGAGDTFAGFLIAALAQGLSPETALRRASAAAALKVTRQGASDAVPDLAELETFLAQQR